MSKRVLIPIADGSEDLETVTLIDVLRRAEFEVLVASAEERRMLTCARGTRITADAMLLDVLAQDFDLIVLPGGMPGAKTLGGLDFAAICAAPAVALHPYGVLKGRQVTCYPGMSDNLTGTHFLDQPVVVDGNCITSQGPATALEFALTLVERLAGRGKRREVADAMLVPATTN